MKLLKLTVFLCVALCSNIFAGAWGTGSFENDDALDWADELERVGSHAVIFTTLTTAVQASYLEAPEGSAALAAAEVVAALSGNPTKMLPEGLAAWVTHKKPPTAELVRLANKAITAVTNSSKSELYQLWEGSDEWLQKIADLRSRLNTQSI